MAKRETPSHILIKPRSSNPNEAVSRVQYLKYYLCRYLEFHRQTISRFFSFKSLITGLQYSADCANARLLPFILQPTVTLLHGSTDAQLPNLL